MESLGDIAHAFQPIFTALSTFVSISNKASEKGASEFTVELNDAIIEMQDKVMAAQTVALQAQDYVRQQDARIAELEAKVTDPAWKGRYFLYRQFPEGDTVYRLRAEHESEEALHDICTACCDVRHQNVKLLHGGKGALKCPSCATVFVVDPNEHNVTRFQRWGNH